MKKAILTIVVTLSVIAGVVVWFMQPGVTVNIQEILMLLGLLLVIVFALFFGIRRIRDARANLPVEDEFSKNIMRKAAATAYYVSLYFWLAMMFMVDKIDLERSSLLGAGIMGMAIIFALSWVYHRYIRKAHD